MKKRIASLLLACVLTLGLLPMEVLARETDTAVVYLTVSVRGVLASDRDGQVMARRPVTVTDLDGDGTLTYDEALTAAHAAYCAAGTEGYSAPGGYVSRLWGEDSYNTLFFLNDTGLTGGVTDATVRDGDALTASVNLDDTYYADWYAFFDRGTAEVSVGTALTLTLKGHLGMAWSEEDLKDVPLSGVAAGVWEDGTFVPLDGAVTGEDGRVTLSFDRPGTYYVTASGTVPDEVVVDWSTYETATVPCPIIAPACVVMVTEEQSGGMSDSEAVAAIYGEFSDSAKKYSSATGTPLVFPLTYNGTEYTNVVDYLKAWAKAETGREVTVNYTPSLSETTYTEWNSGSPVTRSYTGMDETGNITQDYFKDNNPKLLNCLKNVTFTVGGETSSAIASLYIRVTSLQRTPQEVADYVAENLCFARIRNGSASPDAVTRPLGAVSGSTVSLPTSSELYGTASASVAWTLKHVSGKSDALTLSGSKTAVSRPNVGEEDARFVLTATVTSKTDPAVTAEASHDLTVPAFAGVPVTVRVPEGASLSLTDGYYGNAAVDGKYIVQTDGAPAGWQDYICTLHTNADGGAQSFGYTVSKPGFLTKTGTFTVTGAETEPVVIDLTASSDIDTRLASLEILTPAVTGFDFDPEVTEYTVEVSGAQFVKLTAAAATEGASVKLTSYYKSVANANSGVLTTTGASLSASGTACYLPDAADTMSHIAVTVTAPAGSIQVEPARTYTIHVKKTASTGPLTGLTLTASSSGTGTKNTISAGDPVPAEETLTPAFAAGDRTGAYTYTVNYWRDRLTVKPTAAGCAITVNGGTVDSGKTSGEIPLEVGDNTVAIRVTKDGETVDYTVTVHRKAELRLTDVTLDEGALNAALPENGSGWTGSCGFAYSADTVHVTFHTNLTDEEEEAVTVLAVLNGVTCEGRAGEPMALPVGDAEKAMVTVWLCRTAADGTAEGQKYVIGLYRRASDSPSAVESYLPAPGQFVNLPSWQEAGKTLTGSAAVTLGTFGGSVVYRYDEPIRNDPANPYGVDFIVVGNCFTDSDGETSASAAEPAAVMVSRDGETWYELAGSRYYEASTVHGVTVTYTNGDTAFTAAADIPWTDSLGNSGVLPKNSFHTQPYYPDPAYYGAYQTGAGANVTYTAKSVSFTGSRLASGGFCAFGYADCHSAGADGGSGAANPYAADHQWTYNGDGFDLAWAVDEHGDPVELDEVSYIKIYNPVLSYGTTSGEISPEITAVLRAQPAAGAVGVSGGLTALSVNGTPVELTEGVTAYTVDGQGASVLTVTPTAANPDANIYVSAQRVASGMDSAPMTAVGKLRIIVQEEDREPVIYILNVANTATPEDGADLTGLTLTPGGVTAVPDASDTVEFSVDSAVSAVRLTPAASDGAAMTLTGGALETAVTLTSGAASEPLALSAGKNHFLLIVTSASGERTKTYSVVIRRAASGGSSGGTEDGTIRVTFSLTGDTVHYDPDTGEYTGKHTDPTWIARTTVQVPEDSTVQYVTELMLNNAGLDYTANTTYISGINGLAELDNGPNSGWMYRHNGTIADEGWDSRTLRSGDTVQWFYTDDYTKETGYQGSWDAVNSGSVPAGTAAVSNVMDLIRAIGTVNADSGPAIQAARAAYDRLADAQKELVTNYSVLTGAEAAWAALTGGLPFTDVEGHWALDAIRTVYGVGLMKGTAADTFSPESAVSRGMIVTILWRLEGSPAPESAAPFTDVAAESYCADAAAWASASGIAAGYGDGDFRPNAPVTREELAALLYRYAAWKQAGVTARGDLSTFADEASVGAWSRDAMAWACGTGLLTGTERNTLEPKSGATRAQTAVILTRWLALSDQDG